MRRNGNEKMEKRKYMLKRRGLKEKRKRGEDGEKENGQKSRSKRKKRCLVLKEISRGDGSIHRYGIKG